MLDYKNAKVKEWNSKMTGFFNKDHKAAEQMAQEEQEAELRKKIAR